VDPCPPEDVLAAFVAGNLEAAVAAEVERHLGDCSRCAQAIGGAVSLAPPDVLRFDPANLVARRLGDFVLGERIGAGGFGAVYRAGQQLLEREVAVKVLHALQVDARDAQDLLHEARLATRLDHPYAAHVYGVGVEPDGLLWIAMELVRGTSLAALIADQGALPLARFAPLFDALCEVVHTAHEKGIVHRDLKPSNVMVVSRAGRLLPKLLDFGVAQLAQEAEVAPATVFPAAEAGDRTPALDVGAALIRGGIQDRPALIGTPAYMAPELWQGQVADARSDQYALALICWQALAGRRPFDGKNLAEISEAHARQPLPSLVAGARTPLDEVLARAAAKDPAQRYPSVLELAEAFRAACEASAPVEAPPRPRRRFAWRWPALVACAGLLAAATRWSSTPPTPRGRRPSVAVFGFRDLGGVSEAAWLSTALGELLAGQLVADGGMRRVPADGVNRFVREVDVDDAAALSGSQLGNLRAQLDADFVLGGSFLKTGGRLRIDLALRDTARAETVLAVVEEGDESRLFDLVSSAGERLRRRLGASAPTAAAARAALPADLAAARLYSEGLARLRLVDPLGARALLEEATRRAPDFPLAHAALSEALGMLGQRAGEVREARLAWERAASLGREQQLVVEARFRAASREWPRAVELHRTLRELFPDVAEYALGQAIVEVDAGRARDALATLERLRGDAPAAARDPRVEIVEARACELVADYACVDRAARAAAEKARAVEARELVGEALLAESYAAMQVGDRARAARVAAEALAVHRDVGNPAGVAAALRGVARVAWKTGQLPAARAAYAEAVEILRDLGDDDRRARALLGLAGVESDLNRPLEALRLYREARPLLEVADNRAALVATHLNLGQQLVRVRELDEAERELQRALTLAREMGKRNFEAIALESLGALYLDRGELARAVAIERLAQGVAAHIQDATTVAQTGVKLGEALAAHGELELAEVELARAIAALERLRETGRLAYAKVELARLLLFTGRLEEAERSARSAVALHEEAGVASALSPALLARVLVARGRAREARELIARARARSREMAVETAAAEVELASGRAGQAVDTLTRAIAGELPRVPDRLDAQVVLAAAQRAAGRRREAEALRRAVLEEARAGNFLLVLRRAR
jgi:serine/threonine protein kinase